MRVSLEWFLLDNFAVNWLLLKLSGALGGAAVGPRRAALMLTEYDPRDCADTVIHALAISDQELKEWCQNGAVR